MNDGAVINGGLPSSAYDAEKTRLYELLKAAQPQEVVTYDQMIKVCGLDIRAKYRGLFYAVRNRLEREQAASFDTVRGVGYICLTNDGIVGSSTTKVQGLRRATRRIRNRLAVAEYTKLSPPFQVAYSVNMAIAQIVFEGTKAKTRKALEAASAKTKEAVLPLTDTLALLAH